MLESVEVYIGCMYVLLQAVGGWGVCRACRETMQNLSHAFMPHTLSDDGREACAGFLWTLITTYIVIRYQQKLDLKGSAWVTFFTAVLMLALAIDAGIQSDFHRKNILSRQVVMGVWISLQVSESMRAVLYNRKGSEMGNQPWIKAYSCLLYTSDAADE